MIPQTENAPTRLRWSRYVIVAFTLALGMAACLEAQFTEEKGATATKVQMKVIRRRAAAPSSNLDDDSNSAARVKSPSIELKPGEISMLVQFRDGGSLRMKLRTKTIPIVTVYGKLEIPAEDIQAIELAPRLPDDISKKVKEAIGRLGSAKAEERTAAGPALFNMRDKAYIALVRASHSKDKQLAKLADDLVDDLRALVSPELVESRTEDAVETSDSRFAGDIALSTLEATSPQFGNVEVKLADVQSASFESGGSIKEIKSAIENLIAFDRQTGKTMSVRLTGALGGRVWGAGTYTTHSSLATAAVHAGILRPGQSGVVRVRILREQDSFGSSYQNSVPSQPWNRSHGAFTFVR